MMAEAYGALQIPLPTVRGVIVNIGLVCEGDASISETVFSGTAKRMYVSLLEQGDHVYPVDASMKPAQRALAAIASFSTDKAKWRSKFRYGSAAANFRTAAANASLGDKTVDALLQIGASFDPPSTIPYAIYSDWNMALDSVEAKAGNGASRGLALAELESIGLDHARRYRGAAMIFTISERLRQSFIDLYDIPPDKVMTAYAGPNFDVDLIDKALASPKQPGSLNVLFIAKEFKRKGGDLVAQAFKEIQQVVPGARLLFAGTDLLPNEFEGIKNIEHLGLLDKTNAEQLKKLLNAYRQADMLVLPSRHDPFPTVIREAMFFGLPCVASDIWAMSEMIDDGKTGFLIPPNDADALARQMLILLARPELRAEMGAAARRKAEDKFSWGAVGHVLHTGMELIRKGVRP